MDWLWDKVFFGGTLLLLVHGIEKKIMYSWLKKFLFLCVHQLKKKVLTEFPKKNIFNLDSWLSEVILSKSCENLIFLEKFRKDFFSKNIKYKRALCQIFQFWVDRVPFCG